MRKLKPAAKRPFKLRWSLMLCVSAFYVCNLMLYWCGFDIIWKLCVAMLCGLCIHLVYQKKTLMACLLRLHWFVFYLVGLFVLSYLGSFGGIGLISFPLDCLIVLPFSVVSLYISQKSLIAEHESDWLIEHLSQMEPTEASEPSPISLAALNDAEMKMD